MPSAAIPFRATSSSFETKAADRIELPVWEDDGYAIWYKRLEIGTFRFPAAGDGSPQVEIRRRGPDHAACRRRSLEREEIEALSLPRAETDRLNATHPVIFFVGISNRLIAP